MAQLNGLYKVTQNHSDHGSMVVNAEWILCQINPMLLLFGSVVADFPNTAVHDTELMPALYFLGQLYAICRITDYTWSSMKHLGNRRKTTFAPIAGGFFSSQPVCSAHKGHRFFMLCWALQGSETESCNEMTAWIHSPWSPWKHSC